MHHPSFRQDEWTPLLTGACAGVEVVQLLLDAKAELGVMNKVGPAASARVLTWRVLLLLRIAEQGSPSTESRKLHAQQHSHLESRHPTPHAFPEARSGARAHHQTASCVRSAQSCVQDLRKLRKYLITKNLRTGVASVRSA